MTLLDGCKVKKGCICKPVMEIEPTNCPPDILHMKKGIISKLLNQVVDWVVIQGKERLLIAQMKEHKIPFAYVMFYTATINLFNFVDFLSC